MPAPRSRLALAITLSFLAGGIAIVLFAVVAVARDVRDDAAWAAIVLGLALAAWGVWFHRLGNGSGGGDDRDGDRGVVARARDPLGTIAVVGIITAGAHWLLRGALDRSAAEAVVVAAITLGLWVVNRGADAVVRRRRRSG